ncbi:MAG: putative bifunctional diguanylate cyclase/phosphodiesterase [Kiloniellales bacterium]
MPQVRTPDSGLAQLARLQAAIVASGDVTYCWDFASDALQWEGSTLRLFDGQAGDWPKTADAFHMRINPEDLPLRMRALSAHLSVAAPYDCEYRVRDYRGAFQWVHDRGAIVLSPNGTPLRFVGMLRLVNQRKEHEARLEYLATFDDLTGHYNKLRLREALDQALAQSLRAGLPGAFLVIGMDQMGMINTAYGHEAGDAVLVAISQRLDRCLRANDIVGRLGSDRFGVLLANCSEEQATIAAERILQAIRQTPIQLKAGKLWVTASASLVLFPENAKTSFDVIVKAEGALLQAKAAGRDCVRPYCMTEEQRQSYRTNMSVGEQVKLALRENRLIFAYQPVVDAERREVSFYECLLRIRGADGELIPAARFIPHVEQLGLMRTIDRHALDLAMAELERHPEITLAINISGLTAADRSWLRALIGRLKGRPEVARRLIVEITETAALHDIEDSARFVTAVRNLGCRVAVDDFGAGYTTFKHLKSLTVDVVKIDGSFVRDISNSPENQLFIRNLLSLAKSFGLSTVAEFVESEADARYLAQEGVDFLQGHYFGKPQVSPAWRRDSSPAASKAGSATVG